MRVTDYICKFLNYHGIDTVFTITGGFAMHLNDSFGKNNNWNVYYQHHEQACGYSAVGYSKANSKPSVVCTTAGCAATNAITPCLVAYQDSIPVLFISGQVKSFETTTKMNTEQMNLRHYSGADCDIISMVKPITKFAKEIYSLEEIEQVLIDTVFNLKYGRPGPVWLSVPLDIQGTLMNSVPGMELPRYLRYLLQKSHAIIPDSLNKLRDLLKNSKRPLIIAGNGIKLANCVHQFNDFVSSNRIPVVVTILGTDVIETDNEMYFGKIGLIGDRCGNFVLQNCDLLISLGCRLSQGIVGYRPDWFAREAKIVYVDNDLNELKKENLNYTLKIHTDLNDFFNNLHVDYVDYGEWIDKCNHWKLKWGCELPPCVDSVVNPYHVLKTFYETAPPNKITLCSGGSIVTNVWHMCTIKKGDKFLHSSQGDMGFELPAAIGAQIAYPDKMVVALVGEGSFQLNIQELQTIVQNKLPIKIIVFNNGGYGAIKITQESFFKQKYGVDTSSGISFPDTEKVANAYGIKYIPLQNEQTIENFLEYPGTIIMEVFCCIQVRYPKLSAMKNEDGTFVNRPFEDMDPFLSREELAREMIVQVV